MRDSEYIYTLSDNIYKRNNLVNIDAILQINKCTNNSLKRDLFVKTHYSIYVTYDNKIKYEHINNYK